MNGTSTERKPDNRTDNRLTAVSGKPNERGQKGYSSVGRATVSKSGHLPCNSSALSGNRYQDIPGTGREPDNGEFADQTNENPGARAGATGAESIREAAQLPRQNSPKRRRSAMSLWATPAHKAAAKALGYFLTLGATGARSVELALILRRRLSEDERAAIAYAALLSMEDDNAYQVASLAIFGGEVPA